MANNLIILGFARSGITILDRIISSDKRLICLSEINTRYVCPTKPNTPREQIKNWYNVDIKKNTTLGEIRGILEYCEKNNKILIIRDWSFSSFVPLKYNKFNPKKTLVTIDDIEKKFPDKFKIVCMTRNPVDVWLSMRDSVKTFHDKNLNYLFEFITDVKIRNLEILKYEDFCKNPISILTKIYSQINIPVKKNIELSNKVIGDINFPMASRGAILDNVSELDRRNISNGEIEFLRNKTKASEICKMLDYKEDTI